MPWTYVVFIFSSVETSPPGFLLVVAVLKVSLGCFLGEIDGTYTLSSCSVFGFTSQHVFLQSGVENYGVQSNKI